MVQWVPQPNPLYLYHHIPAPNINLVFSFQSVYRTQGVTLNETVYRTQVVTLNETVYP